MVLLFSIDWSLIEQKSNYHEKNCLSWRLLQKSNTLPEKTRLIAWYFFDVEYAWNEVQVFPSQLWQVGDKAYSHLYHYWQSMYFVRAQFTTSLKESHDILYLAVQNSSIGDLVPSLGTTNNQSLHSTTE